MNSRWLSAAKPPDNGGNTDAPVRARINTHNFLHRPQILHETMSKWHSSNAGFVVGFRSWRSLSLAYDRLIRNVMPLAWDVVIKQWKIMPYSTMYCEALINHSSRMTFFVISNRALPKGKTRLPTNHCFAMWFCGQPEAIGKPLFHNVVFVIYPPPFMDF